MISDVFGSRVNPVTGKDEFHKGIDLAAESGTPVLACFDGMVEACGHSESYGYFVKIKGQEYACVYAHLEKIEVSEGDNVTQGQKVALSGSTGQSTGPHLHFELYRGEKNIDPYFIFKE